MPLTDATEPDLNDVLGGDYNDDTSIGVVTQIANFLTKWNKVDEKDPFKWVLDKTRLDERQISAIAYYVKGLEVIIHNDLRTIWGTDPEKYKDTPLPMTEGTIAYMHGRISLHGEVRTEVKESIMAPDLRDKREEKTETLTFTEKLLGKKK